MSGGEQTVLMMKVLQFMPVIMFPFIMNFPSVRATATIAARISHR